MYLQIWCADVVFDTKDGASEVVIPKMCVYKTQLDLLQADTYLIASCMRYVAGATAMKLIDNELTTGLKRIKRINYKFFLSESNVTYAEYVQAAKHHRSRMERSFQFTKSRVLVSRATGKNPTRARTEDDLPEAD